MQISAGGRVDGRRVGGWKGVLVSRLPSYLDKKTRCCKYLLFVRTETTNLSTNRCDPPKPNTI